MQIELIKNYVKAKHGNQKRRQGTPYYLHPFAVCEIVRTKNYDDNYLATALLHDVLEDTDATCEEISSLSNRKVLEAVKLLTKEKGYTMEEYIHRIKNNKIALMVKLADRLHNLQEAHFVGKKFMIKYLNEAKKWYIDLAKNTDFEQEILHIVNELEHKLNNKKDHA